VLEGGARPDDPALASGFYLRPTILDGCTNDMVVAREEIFGPVVSVITFETEDEAVRLANDTPYGLSGSLWTRDGARQLRVARALRTGASGVNSNSSVFPQAPFGGYKASGVGKELGMEGLVHNTELKGVHLDRSRGRGANSSPLARSRRGRGKPLDSAGSPCPDSRKNDAPPPPRRAGRRVRTPTRRVRKPTPARPATRRARRATRQRPGAVAEFPSASAT
jgi:hypothetical protein